MTNLDLLDLYSRELLRARKKAGRMMGVRMIRAAKTEAKSRLVKVSPRFLQGMRYKVNARSGNLTVMSLAPMSRTLEDGGVIKPATGRYLAVATELAYAGANGQRLDLARLRAAKQTFVIRNAKGNLIVMRKVSGSSTNRKVAAGLAARRKTIKAFPVATLLERITLPPRLNFTGTVEQHLDDYADAVERALVE
jgi:hypothetical protein